MAVEPGAYTLVPGDEPEAADNPDRLGEDAFWEAPAPGSLRARGLAIIQSLPFQCVCAGIISMNALIIGFETDCPSFVWDLLEHLCLALFTLELVLRLMLMGPKAYFDLENPEILWNAFDATIVCLGLLDAGATVLIGKKAGDLATIFRIIRLLRILRIFRIVRFLKQLYMLAFGFALAIEAVFWVAVLMMFFLYLCSIVLVRTVGRLGEDRPHHEMLHSKFGTIRDSMLTLFELFSQPNIAPYADLLGTYPPFAAFLVMFILFGSFGMIALLTGVISDSVFSKNEMRHEEDRLLREDKHRHLRAHCESTFDACQKNDRGEVMKSSIEHALAGIKDMFGNNGVEMNDAELKSLMECLDVDLSGGIKKEEFLSAIDQIAEGVRPMLILQVHYSVQHLVRQMESFRDTMKDISRRMDVLAGTDPETRTKALFGVAGQTRRVRSAATLAPCTEDSAPNELCASTLQELTATAWSCPGKSDVVNMKNGPLSSSSLQSTLSVSAGPSPSLKLLTTLAQPGLRPLPVPTTAAENHAGLPAGAPAPLEPLEPPPAAEVSLQVLAPEGAALSGRASSRRSADTETTSSEVWCPEPPEETNGWSTARQVSQALKEQLENLKKEQHARLAVHLQSVAPRQDEQQAQQLRQCEEAVAQLRQLLPDMLQSLNELGAAQGNVRASQEAAATAVAAMAAVKTIAMDSKAMLYEAEVQGLLLQVLESKTAAATAAVSAMEAKKTASELASLQHAASCGHLPGLGNGCPIKRWTHG